MVPSNVVLYEQQYSKEELTALEMELNTKCPISKSAEGIEVHSCPMIDRIVSDYRALRAKVKLARKAG